MEIKKKMTEMKSADVRFISLVTRAANRIPFRVVKSDKEHQMGSIDLTSLRRSVLKQEAKTDAPAIVGVVVFEQTDAAVMGKVTDVLKAEGFAIDKAFKNDDGTVLYKQEGFPDDEAGTTLVRLSANMAIVMKGFDAQAEVMANAADFSEVIPAEGFFHGMTAAQEALGTTVQSILKKSDSSAVASALIKATTTKFNEYVTALSEGVPAAAFKADTLLTEVIKPVEAAAVVADVVVDTAAVVVKEGEEVKADDAVVDAPAAAVTADVVVDAAVVDTVAKADAAPDFAALIATALKAELGPVTIAMTNLAEKQKEIEEKVETFARKADDASKQVQTTVSNLAKDDAAPKQAAKKSDDDPRTGCFDSATFAKRR